MASVVADPGASRRLLRLAGASLGALLLALAACRPGEPGGGKRSDGGGPSSPTERGGVQQVEIPAGGAPVAIGAGQVHFRDFALGPGELLHVVVEQAGLDVSLALLGPDGGEVVRVDSPTGRYGAEEIFQVVEAAGRYRVEIQAFDGEPEAGRYQLREASHRPARREDHERVEGDRLDREGRRLAAAKDWPGAIRGFTAALETWRRLELSGREAETLWQLGRVLYDSGDLPGAREAWERALSWYRATDDRQQAYLLHDLGKLALRLGDPEAAIADLEQARARFERDGEEREAVSALSALGTAWRTRGAFQTALECFEAAAGRSRRLGLPAPEAAVQIDRAALLLELDLGAEALAAYEEALRLYRGLGDAEGAALALRGIADAGIRTGDLDRAEEAAREAVAAFPTDGTSRARAAALGSLGNVLRKRGDWAGARGALTAALAVARAARYRRDEAVILTGLAYAVAGGGEPERALGLYAEALAIFREMGSRGGEAMVQARSAESLRLLGRLDEARARVEAALAAVEDLRAGTERQDYRLSYFGSRQQYYETAVDVLLDLEAKRPGAGFGAQALAVHERRLARELLAALADPPAATGDPMDPGDPGLAAEEQRLEQDLSSLAGQPGGGAEVRLAALAEQLQQVRGRRRGAARRGQGGAAATVDLAGAQALLDDGSLALVYSLGEEHSRLFEITRRGLRIHPLPPRAQIEARALALLEAFQQTHSRSAGRRTALARELGELLLGPAAAGLSTRERLVVVAEGALQDLPFAALAPPDGQHAFLIESHEVVQLPSLSMLATLRRAEAARPAGPGRIAIFADPVFGAGDPRAAHLAPGAAGAAPDSHPPDPYRRLSGARREVAALTSRRPGEPPPWVALGFDASREALLAQDWRGFGLLYFATHAVVHRRPELSGLVLSRLDAQGRPQAGFVTGFEISRLSLPVDLVVLSACETAEGTRVRGEGTLGLSWSFLQAGAARVVATLWPVDDGRTAALMARFLELYRQDGLPPAAALRQAQREALARPGALPRDWAGLVLIGDAGRKGS